MKIIFSIISVLFSSIVFAQSEHELLLQFKKEKNDSLKFYFQRDLGYLYEFEDSAKAMRYYRQNMAIADKLNDPYLKSMAWLDYGNVQFNFNNYPKSILYFIKSHDFSSEAKDHRRMGIANLNTGNALYKLGKFDIATKYILQAIKDQEIAKDSSSMALSYSNLAILFEDMGKLDDALNYVQKCKNICQSIYNLRYYTGACITEAIIWRKKGNNAEMQRNIEQAADGTKLVDHDFYKAGFYQNISGLYFDSEQFLKANQYADSSLKYFYLSGNSPESAAILMSKGLSLLKLNQMQEGKKFLDQALKLALKAKDWQSIREIYLCFSDLSANNGDWMSAYKYQKLYDQFKDSTYRSDLLEKSSELAAKFNSEKQQIELDRLSDEIELKTLKEKTQNRNWWFVFSLVIFVLIIFILLFIYQKRKSQLIQKSAELKEEKIRRFEKEKQITVLDSMLKGEENERSRVAKDLHDGVGSLLSGVKLSLASMNGNMIINEQQARIYEKSLRQLDDAISEMRRVAHNMMPAVLVNSGLIQATEQLTNSLSESTQIHIHFEHHQFQQRLPNEYEVIIYRIIQELLNNSIKHAQANEIIVQLNFSKSNVHLVVEDNGNGFDMKLWENSSGMGFHNLKNRVAYLNGKINVRSNSEGTSFLIEFDLNHAS